VSFGHRIRAVAHACTAVWPKPFEPLPPIKHNGTAMRGRNDITLLIGLTVATLVIFQRPIR
jgi:hypothetical protein